MCKIKLVQTAEKQIRQEQNRIDALYKASKKLEDLQRNSKHLNDTNFSEVEFAEKSRYLPW